MLICAVHSLVQTMITGLLSEFNTGACQEQGIAFVGPPSSAILAMGELRVMGPQTNQGLPVCVSHWSHRVLFYSKSACLCN